MPKCCTCGKKASIYTGKRWWCEHHYLILKKRAEKIRESNETLAKDFPKMDFGLIKV